MKNFRLIKNLNCQLRDDVSMFLIKVIFSSEPPRRFEEQLAGLLRRGCQAWPLRQVLQCLERELPIPRKTFVVTFDDGYANNLIHAYPILTKLHVPATVFVAGASETGMRL